MHSKKFLLKAFGVFVILTLIMVLQAYLSVLFYKAQIPAFLPDLLISMGPFKIVFYYVLIMATGGVLWCCAHGFKGKINVNYVSALAAVWFFIFILSYLCRHWMLN